LLEPFSKRVTTWNTASVNFIGWLDSERYLQSAGPYNPTIVNVANGKERTIDNNARQFEFIAPAPVHCPGIYIGMYYVSNSNGGQSSSIDQGGRAADVIAFFRKDLSPGKIVWTEPRGGASGQTQSQVAPKVDPIGEFVGWTIWRSNRPYVAIKATNDPSSRPPQLYGDSWPKAYFCDFTEQGEILANVQDSKTNKFRLVVLHRDGKLNRELGTDVDAAEGVVASWRKYEHR
jgi:hypothetical protein